MASWWKYCNIHIFAVSTTWCLFGKKTGTTNTNQRFLQSGQRKYNLFVYEINLYHYHSIQMHLKNKTKVVLGIFEQQSCVKYCREKFCTGRRDKNELLVKELQVFTLPTFTMASWKAYTMCSIKSDQG